MAGSESYSISSYTYLRNRVVYVKPSGGGVDTYAFLCRLLLYYWHIPK